MGRPQQLRPSVIILSEAETERVRVFIARVNCLERAKAMLGLGDSTFDAARMFGRMQAKTRVRILEALDREEGIAP